MKIKIGEDLISEFIGADLEPIEGDMNPIQSVFTNVNYIDVDDEDNIPQTTDKFIQHARRPWWWSNVYGGYGFTSVGTVSEGQTKEITETQVKEDILTKKVKTDDEIVMNKKIPTLDELDKIYSKPLIKKQVVEFIKMLQNINLDEKNEGDVLAIVLNYLINNINTGLISKEFKKEIIDGLK